MLELVLTLPNEDIDELENWQLDELEEIEPYNPELIDEFLEEFNQDFEAFWKE